MKDATSPSRYERLPFKLPQRPLVTRIRQVDPVALRAAKPGRLQPMAGFDETYADIVDYIVRITEEIWVDRAVGRIYETYDHACTIYSPYGVVRSVQEVVASTVSTLNGFPDGELHHVNVAWDGDDAQGFYTSHLGFSRSTNLGASNWGPATGLRIGVHFVADCITRANFVHTEWLVRDNGAAVRQLGLDPHVVARRIAENQPRDKRVHSSPTALLGQAPRPSLQATDDSVDSWARVMFDQLWNQRRLDRIGHYFSTDSICHAGGGRVAEGLRNQQALMLLILSAMPDAVMQVDKVTWSDETDGVIVAVRWRLEGSSQGGALLGDCPVNKPVLLNGMSHLRLNGAQVVEHWMIFDEIGALVHLYRA
ncbi:MAG TPA: ester cyclase [Rubrivivax sp.]|nr:ester cyclase [Rubrivivax sp.]